jgi:hypothetical protein
VSEERWPVLMTRRLPQPAMDRIAERCDITLHEGEFAMPRDELLRAVGGKVGAVTLLTDKVDDEFLDAAGPSSRSWRTTPWASTTSMWTPAQGMESLPPTPRRS